MAGQVKQVKNRVNVDLAIDALSFKPGSWPVESVIRHYEEQRVKALEYLEQVTYRELGD